MFKNTQQKWKYAVVAIMLGVGFAAIGGNAVAKDGETTKETSGNGNSAAVVEVAAEIAKLKQAVTAQQEEFRKHTQELETERSVLNEELDRIAALEVRLGVGSEKVESEGVSPKAEAPATLVSLRPQSAQQPGSQINIVTPEHPLSFKIGNADFTPGGFVDLTGIYRSADVGSGLGTSFTSIPFNNTLPQAWLSEFRETSQGTRISLKVDANITPGTVVTGYIESDFNGYVPANANQSTNGDTMRLRLAWAQVRQGKWELLGGQSWSLLTPTRVGLSPLPGDVFTTLRVDSNYVAGLVYARQTGLRVVYHPTKWWTVGGSVENPDQYVPSSVYFPGGSSSIFANQFDSGSSSTTPSNTGTNTAIPNVRPDFIVKSAFDWTRWGRMFHVELSGVVRSFKDFQNLASPNVSNAVIGGGGSVNLNFEVIPRFHLIANSFYSDGGARYIGALGPDVIVRPDGKLSSVHAGSGVAGFEWQARPKLLVDGYYSGAYFDRNYALTSKALGAPFGSNYYVGFGYPGSPNSSNRAYQEATFGMIPTLWSSTNYGKLQLIAQSSYVVRSPWYVAPGSPKNAHIVLTYLDLRYLIP